MNAVNLKLKPTRMRYYNDNTNYGVYDFSTSTRIQSKAISQSFDDKKEDEFGVGVIVGCMPELLLGYEYNITAKEVYNKKYNSHQLEFIESKQDIPKDNFKKKQFLKFILTDIQAKTLLEVYPDIIEKVINNEEIDLTKTKGIKEYTFERIKTKIIENYVLFDILNYLSPYGIKYNQIKKIVKGFSSPLIAKQEIKNNFYILTELDGFGFKTADKIALKINKDLRKSKKRAIAFISWYLNDIAKQEGHTWVNKNKLINVARGNIKECVNIVKKIIGEESKEYKHKFFINDKIIGLQKFYRQEQSIIQELTRIDTGKNEFENIDKSKVIEYVQEIEKKQGFNFTEEQKKSILSVIDNNVIILSGSAGSGKSSCLNGIVQVIENFKNESYVAQCALSAKAAQRIYEITGRQAFTIHRLLSYDGTKFRHNEKFKMSYDVIIADEFSMNNIWISLSLFKAVKDGAKLILVFDNAQLPPIGAGAVANDLLEYSNFAKFKLTKVHRQAEDSGILKDANLVRVQKNPINKLEPSISHGVENDMRYKFIKDRDKIHKFAINAYKSAVDKFGIDNVALICPRKDIVTNSVAYFNQELQEIINTKTSTSEEITFGNKIYRENDKVIHKKNNKEKNIYNGETGYIKEIINNTVIVDYGYDIYRLMEDGIKEKKYVEYKREELDEIDLAYTSSIHSYQGSQIDVVIIVLDNTHYMLLDSTILYTAITRAVKNCLLIVEPNAFNTCIKTNKGNNRNTFLSFLLQQ